MKAKRADVRNLEESILYMQGQRDQAEVQGQSHLQMAENAAKRQAALQTELSTLEEKQFAGLDIPAMREELVDLSARYEESLRDGHGSEEQNAIHALREKIAGWQAEQYQSKYAQPLAGAVSQEAEELRQQIQTVGAAIEYGNLSQEELDRLAECWEELRQCSAELAAAEKAAGQPPEDIDGQMEQARQKISELKKQVSNAAQYVSKRAEMLFSALKMNRVEISLYDVVKTTGEVKDVFKFTYAGRRYDRLSLSEKIRAGMEVSELMKRLTGRNYPVFVDNMESVDDLANARPTGQVIMAKCVHGAELFVGPLNSTPAAEQQRAA